VSVPPEKTVPFPLPPKKLHFRKILFSIPYFYSLFVFRKKSQKNFAPLLSLVVTHMRWSTPAKGMLKIDTYASYFESTSTGSTVLVIRNHREYLIRAQTLWYEHATN
jgi:hypothetical protein